MPAESARSLRCAIYTRKSTEHGLDQEFNSLDAQREACEAYIKSQASQGWKLLPQHYDDPAYSGGTLHRPALKRLLLDIAAGKVDVVVVYKIDRLTRSLADFAKLVETFDVRSVSFVAVTQQFNTTTSMGRLTLNILLSFAQFERELASERVKDKVAASRKKGKWTGGTVPLGYDARDKKLVINKTEAQTVRKIFQLYLEVRSFSKLVAELDRRRIVTKRRNTKVAKYQGGIPFTYGPLAYFLKNRIYLGEIHHGGKWFRASMRRSSTERPSTASSSCSRRTTSGVAPNSRRAAPCSKASCLTIRVTGWARRFPARMACDIASTSAPPCADEGTKPVRSGGFQRQRSKISSRRRFGTSSMQMRQRLTNCLGASIA